MLNLIFILIYNERALLLCVTKLFDIVCSEKIRKLKEPFTLFCIIAYTITGRNVCSNVRCMKAAYSLHITFNGLLKKKSCLTCQYMTMDGKPNLFRLTVVHCS